MEHNCMKRIYLLLITLGALVTANAQDRPRFRGMRDVNNVIDNTADSLEKAKIEIGRASCRERV